MRGGDGGTDIPLAVLPTGTGNLLARNLGLPLGLDDALVVAFTGIDRLLDMGSANGRSLVVMAGLGFDAKMLDSASEPLKKRVGWAAMDGSISWCCRRGAWPAGWHSLRTCCCGVAA